MAKKAKHGGKRPGAGHPVTTGSSATRPVHFKVTAAQRAELDAEAKRLGLSSADVAAKRRTFPALGAIVASAMLSLIGCGGLQVDQSKAVAAPTRADEAVAAVEAFYGLPAAGTTVIWYGGAALNCVDPGKPWCDGGHCWHSDNGNGCVAGESKDGIALVSDWGGGRPISQMGTGSDAVMPHELAHLRWGDPNHTGHAFAVGGESDQATQMLADLGM